jgi:sensor c-di-GMP phosphodiesterase-like protein
MKKQGLIVVMMMLVLLFVVIGSVPVARAGEVSTSKEDLQTQLSIAILQMEKANLAQQNANLAAQNAALQQQNAAGAVEAAKKALNDLSKVIQDKGFVINQDPKTGQISVTEKPKEDPKPAPEKKAPEKPEKK